jgi:hypothetical protein
MRKTKWYYGRTTNGLKARWDPHTSRVQFLLWAPGEQGHPDGYWADLGFGHEIILDPL